MSSGYVLLHRFRGSYKDLVEMLGQEWIDDLAEIKQLITTLESVTAKVRSNFAKNLLEQLCENARDGRQSLSSQLSEDHWAYKDICIKMNFKSTTACPSFLHGAHAILTAEDADEIERQQNQYQLPSDLKKGHVLVSSCYQELYERLMLPAKRKQDGAALLEYGPLSHACATLEKLEFQWEKFFFEHADAMSMSARLTHSTGYAPHQQCDKSWGPGVYKCKRLIRHPAETNIAAQNGESTIVANHDANPADPPQLSPVSADGSSSQYGLVEGLADQDDAMTSNTFADILECSSLPGNIIEESSKEEVLNLMDSLQFSGSQDARKLCKTWRAYADWAEERASSFKDVLQKLLGVDTVAYISASGPPKKFLKFLLSSAQHCFSDEALQLFFGPPHGEELWHGVMTECCEIMAKKVCEECQPRFDEAANKIRKKRDYLRSLEGQGPHAVAAELSEQVLDVMQQIMHDCDVHRLAGQAWHEQKDMKRQKDKAECNKAKSRQRDIDDGYVQGSASKERNIAGSEVHHMMKQQQREANKWDCDTKGGRCKNITGMGRNGHNRPRGGIVKL